MAFCKSCGQELEEDAKFCTFCGTNQWGTDVDSGEETAVEAQETMEIVEEEPKEQTVCRAELDEGTMGATNTATAAPKKSKTGLIVGVSIGAFVVIAALLAAIILGIAQETKKKELAQYTDDFEKAIQYISIGGRKASNLGDLAERVWYDAIYHETDFQTKQYVVSGDFDASLNNMYSSGDIKYKVQELKEHHQKVDTLLEQLKEPPKEFEKAYDRFVDLYDAYVSILNVAINPSGSYNTYSQEVKIKSEEFDSCIAKVRSLMPENEKK